MSRLSHDIETFMKFQKVNNVENQQMSPFYRNNSSDSRMPKISIFLETVHNITQSIMVGTDPNNIVFRNDIKTFLNIINHNNFKEYLDKLIKMDYSTLSNIQFLINELIMSIIRSPIAYKGFNMNEKMQFQTVPELCANIIHKFTSFSIKTSTKEYRFHSEFISICEKEFNRYLDFNNLMDENNVYNSDNYKGFMTMFGLLYARNVITAEICHDCIVKIKNTLFKTANSETKVCIRSNTECSNFHKGYENLLSHIIISLQSRIADVKTAFEHSVSELNIWTVVARKNLDAFVSNKPINKILESGTYDVAQGDIVVKTFKDLEKYVDNIDMVEKSIVKKNYDLYLNQYNKTKEVLKKYANFVENLLVEHQDFFNLNQGLKCIDNKNQLVVCLRQYNLLSHNNYGTQLNNIYDMFEGICIIKGIKYRPN